MDSTRALARLHDAPALPEAVERALMQGDLAQLKPEERLAYYRAVCQTAGLNPLTRPFELIKNQNDEYVLYPRRECAEQLRKLHRVSTRVLSREFLDELYIVTVEGSTPDGRTEQAQGIVSLTKPKREQQGTYRDGNPRYGVALDEDGDEIHIPLRGDARANKMMGCESKAKRRVTFALVGLGFLETDGDQVRRYAHVDLQTGEILEPSADGAPPAPAPDDGAHRSLLETARTLYRRAIKPTGSKPLADALVACCFGVRDWAELPVLPQDTLAHGLPLLGALCDRLVAEGPPAAGDEEAWCIRCRDEWERLRAVQAEDEEPTDEQGELR